MANGIRKPSPRGEHGFTLIELVIVMAMMVILVSIVAPRWEVSPSRRVEGMARQMVAHLEMARSRALGQRQLTQVVFDENKRTYTAYVDHNRDGNLSGNKQEAEAFPEFAEQELVRLVNFGRGNATTIPGDPSLDAVTLDQNTLELSVQGIPEPWGTMGTVYLVHGQDSDAVSAITIGAAGSFKAWRWSSSEGAWQ